MNYEKLIKLLIVLSLTNLTSVALSESKKSEPDYTEMKGEQIDILSSLDANEDDDFSIVKNKHNNKNEKISLTEQEKNDLELAKLREIEKQAKIALAKKQKEQRSKLRIEQVKSAQRNKKLMLEWTKDANEKLSKQGQITDDEVNWNGLE